MPASDEHKREALEGLLPWDPCDPVARLVFQALEEYCKWEKASGSQRPPCYDPDSDFLDEPFPEELR